MLKDTLAELETVSLCNGINEKISFLKNPKLSSTVVMKKIFKMTYDPGTTYGIVVKDKDPVNLTMSINEENWTMFKELLGKLSRREYTGNTARDAWNQLYTQLTPLEMKWFTRIINRDLRIGINAKTVNKIWSGLILTFGFQLAVPSDGKNIKLKFPLWVEPKLDGMRSLVYVSGKHGVPRSRKGLVLENIQPLIDSLSFGKEYSNFLLDSEAMGETWNNSISLVKKSSLSKKQRSKLTLWCFDHVVFDGNSDKTPLRERHKRLEKLVARINNPQIIVAPHTEVMNEEELGEYYTKALEDGFEGILMKDPDAPYNNKRSKAWLKKKPVATLDGTITGFYEGRGKNKESLGGFNVMVGKKKFNVGGGFSDEQREYFWLNRDSMIGKTIEFEQQNDKKEVAVSRNPIFLRLREDK